VGLASSHKIKQKHKPSSIISNTLTGYAYIKLVPSICLLQLFLHFNTVTQAALQFTPDIFSEYKHMQKVTTKHLSDMNDSRAYFNVTKTHTP